LDAERANTKNYGLVPLLARYIIEMNWILIAVAIVLFGTWIILRVILHTPLGVLNMLWMMAILFLVLGGVQKLES